jgi:hypothetical protein
MIDLIFLPFTLVAYAFFVGILLLVWIGLISAVIVFVINLYKSAVRTAVREVKRTW